MIQVTLLVHPEHLIVTLIAPLLSLPPADIDIHQDNEEVSSPGSLLNGPRYIISKLVFSASFFFWAVLLLVSYLHFLTLWWIFLWALQC